MELEMAVNGLNSSLAEIDLLCEQLTTIKLDFTLISEKLLEIQNVVDDLNFKNYSNMNIWVKELDDRIQGIFQTRLQAFLLSYLNEFEQFNELSVKEWIEKPLILELKVQD